MAQPLPTGDPTQEGAPDVTSEPRMPHSTRAEGQAGHAASAAQSRARRLPEDDAFLLVESLNGTGGVDGITPRMNATQMSVFRRHCMLPPTIRTFTQLRLTISTEGGKAPNLKTLQGWRARHKWDRLLAEFDLAVDRYRLQDQTARRREAEERQARVGRSMQEIAAQQAARLIREYNAPLRPATDEKGRPLVNPRTGKPIFPPKKSLAGIQGLAMMYRIGVETERVALGMPTSITNERVEGRLDGQVDHRVSGTVTHDHQLSLEEWRTRTRAERMAAAGMSPGGVVEGSLVKRGGDIAAIRALPAPDVVAGGIPRTTLDTLSNAERDALPDDWFDGEATDDVSADVGADGASGEK